MILTEVEIAKIIGDIEGKTGVPFITPEGDGGEYKFEDSTPSRIADYLTSVAVNGLSEEDLEELAGKAALIAEGWEECYIKLEDDIRKSQAGA